jgi:hypothetical protein
VLSQGRNRFSSYEWRRLLVIAAARTFEASLGSRSLQFQGDPLRRDRANDPRCKAERISPMLRSGCDVQPDDISNGNGRDRSTTKIRRSSAQPSESPHRQDRGRINPLKNSDLCWVDIFSEEYFCGRLTRLHEGDHKDIRKPASIIVGPEALARCIDRKTKKMRHIQSRTVCPSISLRRNAFSIRIEVVPAIAS